MVTDMGTGMEAGITWIDKICTFEQVGMDTLSVLPTNIRSLF